MTKFEVGKSYQARSAGDHDCIWTFTVTARTAKFVTLTEESGEVRRVGSLVSGFDGGEWCKPFGTYSLCPVLRAERSVEVAA